MSDMDDGEVRTFGEKHDDGDCGPRCPVVGCTNAQVRKLPMDTSREDAPLCSYDMPLIGVLEENADPTEWPVVARIVMRGSEPTDGFGMIKLLAEDAQELLKPRTCYEIVNVLGSLIIREVGPSVISSGDPGTGYEGLCWGRDISSLLRTGKHIWFTRKEWEEQRARPTPD